MSLAFKRKRDGRTDYKRRLKLLTSHTIRLVARISNKNIMLQLIEFHPDGDKVLVSAHSRELVKHGWSTARRNIPAAYLTGLLLGKKAGEKSLKKAILDIGRAPFLKGTVLCAALKGVVDAGLEVPHDETVFPVPERLRGEHIKDVTQQFQTVKKQIGIKEEKNA